MKSKSSHFLLLVAALGMLIVAACAGGEATSSVPAALPGATREEGGDTAPSLAKTEGAAAAEPTPIAAASSPSPIAVPDPATQVAALDEMPPTPTETAEPPAQDPRSTDPALDSAPHSEDPEEEYPPLDLAPDPEQPERDPGGISPAYSIYVGLTLEGPPCGGYTNSGGFTHFSLDSVFHGVQFIQPTEGGMPFGGFHAGSLFPDPVISGEGQVDSFDLCPTYDGDRQLSCDVTEGPKALAPEMMVDPYSLALPPAGPTPPAEPSEALALNYNVRLAEGLGPLMRWECGGFYSGAFGGPFDGDLATSFLLPWTQVIAGEDLTIEAIYDDGFYTGKWTLRLIPAGSN
jgi:hypothetical protein